MKGEILLVLLLAVSGTFVSLQAEEADMLKTQPRRLLNDLSKKGRAASCTWTVRYGQTLSGIAASTGVPVWRLLELNPRIRNPDYIQAGWTLSLVRYSMLYRLH
jgi:LysM repeat protein